MLDLFRDFLDLNQAWLAPVHIENNSCRRQM